jgi:prepilin-type N-terminal cleavage/methylation domain-containing protein
MNTNLRNNLKSWRYISRKKGVTLIELLFVVILMGVVSYTMWRVFVTGARTSTRLSQSIELASEARICDAKLSRELRTSVQILSPVEPLNMSSPETSPLLVVLNATNELLVFYVNQQGMLIRQNRTRGNYETVLGNNISAFRVFRKGRRLINYHLELAVDDSKMPGGKRKFSLITSVTLRNNFN